MHDNEILPINFAISDAARLEIQKLREFWNATTSDPAAVAMIGWGFFHKNSGERWEDVVVGFYGESQFAEIAGAVQDASGLPVVFFTTEEHHPKFDGKVVDYAAERGFFLHGPQG